MNLAELIVSHKDGRSFADMERDCGGSPRAARLQQLSTTAPKNFPDPPTITALARGLRVQPATVVLASAESLGIDVRRASPELLDRLPAGIDLLDEDQLRSVVDMVRTFVRVNAAAEMQRFLLQGFMLDAGIRFESTAGEELQPESAVSEFLVMALEDEQRYPGSLNNFYNALVAALDHAREHHDAEHQVVITIGDSTDDSLTINLRHMNQEGGSGDVANAAEKSVSNTGEAPKRSDYTTAARSGQPPSRKDPNRRQDIGQESQEDPRADDAGA